MCKLRFVGLDVHAETIAAAVADGDGGEVRVLGVIPHRVDAIRRLLKPLGPVTRLRVCYEAGPTGYALYWELTALGIACQVIAPSLIPRKPGDRVKTDRRDAVLLARGLRAGDLTAVWIPDRGHEALRDLVRAREAAKKDQLRARHRLGKFLLRHGRRPPEDVTPWTQRYLTWVTQVRFEYAAQEATRLDYLGEVEHAAVRVTQLERALDEAIATAPPALRRVIDALQALRGVARLSAATIVAEVGPLSRFARPRQLMGYAGLGAREASSGPRQWRGGLTKMGNAHLRRIVGEAAWAYKRRPTIGATLRRRQHGLSPGVIATAWTAQCRLHGRYHRLVARGKCPQKAMAAVARELLGFIWAIGCAVDTMPIPAPSAAA
jgi:transposase